MDKKRKKLLEKLEKKLIEGDISEETYLKLSAKYEARLKGGGAAVRSGATAISCPFCGHENPSRARFCAGCGEDMAEAEPVPEEEPVRFRVTEPAGVERGHVPRRRASAEADWYGRCSLICGILGVFVLGFILGPFAIYFGSKGKGTGKGTAGMILGVVGIVIWLLMLATLLSWKG